MQWLINIIQEWAVLNLGYVYRGDPAAQDFTLVDFTIDGLWHVLTLPAFVPIDARLVHLELIVRSAAVNRTFRLRRSGNVNEINVVRVRTQVANIRVHEDCSVSMQPGNRNIEYHGVLAGFTQLDLTVKGWWL